MSTIDVQVIEDFSDYTQKTKQTFRATWRDGPWDGFVLETPDLATLDVRISEIENTGIDFETFLRALTRPTFVYRMANAKVDKNFPGALKTRDAAAEEIDRAVKARARALHMGPT